MPYQCECGKKFKRVVDSRRGEQFIRRRRGCPCGNRITTVEITKERYKRLLEMEDLVSRIIKIVKE